MNRPTVAQALLQGGPADGAVREVECGPDGRPPELLLLGAAAGVVFVGEFRRAGCPFSSNLARWSTP